MSGVQPRNTSTEKTSSTAVSRAYNALARETYANIRTFRKSGEAVDTPV